MNKYIRMKAFSEELFADRKSAETAGRIMQAILACRSPRISDLACAMEGGEEAGNYKRIQRFLDRQDPRVELQRLFNEEADFVIGDPTEIERPYAHKTDYVGTLQDGQTKGFWLLTLATPLRGRAIPFHFVSYSSRTFAEQVSSRNLEHFKAIQEIKQLVGGRPLVFDREFSYLQLLQSLVEADMKFVIRLNLGSQPPTFYYDAEQKRALRLAIAPLNKPKIYRQVYYMGRVKVNLVGIWEFGFKQPLWVITNLEPQLGLKFYFKRMKIDICFRDLKDLLHLDKIMNKSQILLEKMIAMVLLTYAVCVLLGEAIRDVQYANLAPQEINLHAVPEVPDNSRWYLYSGPFLLIKKRYRLSSATLRKIIRRVFRIFKQLLFAFPVRTPV